MLVYRSRLLPLSETFIKEQVSSLQEWRGILIGRQLLDELPLDELTVRLLHPERPSAYQRIWLKAYKALGAFPTRSIERLKIERPSLVHAHFGMDGLDAWHIARTLKLPLLITLHGYDINIHRKWWEAGHGGRSMRHYPDRLLRLAQRPQVSFIAVSEAIRARAIEYGLPAEKIAVNYIGIDTRKFSAGSIPIQQRAHNIVFIGRLVEKKGCEYLLDAMTRIQRSAPDTELTIIGDGPLREDLEKRARLSSIRVKFCGAKSSADVREALNLARVLCLPSITARNGDAEGFGLVLLEAQASGVPVVTSAKGGAQEGILHGTTGLAVPEKAPEDLCNSLLHILNNPDTATTMAANAIEFTKTNFELFKCTRNLEKKYNELTHSGVVTHSSHPSANSENV